LVTHTIKDSFQFVNEVKNMNIRGKYLVSFDVQSLFTNLPLEETIDIVCKHSSLTDIPSDQLKGLLEFCTKDIQFLFNGSLYRQKDGVGMGSPLGPILADIFMSTLEQKIMPQLGPANFYRRYVDDTFVVCESETQAKELLGALNGLHKRITFTMEPEQNDSLHFLDVLLKRNCDGSILRSIFHKQESLQYMHFRSFVPIRYKQNLVRTLFFRAYQICSDETVQTEIQTLTEALEKCGYPPKFIRKYSELRPRKASETTVEKKRIYIALPFKGDNVTELMTRRLRSCIHRVYNAASLVLLSTTTRLPVPPHQRQAAFASQVLISISL
jgi:hypothetical protein